MTGVAGSKAKDGGQKESPKSVADAATAWIPSVVEEYAGEYESDELLSTYRVEVTMGNVILIPPPYSRVDVSPGVIDGRLKPIREDVFSFSSLMNVGFRRDGKGHIIGFNLAPVSETGQLSRAGVLTFHKRN